MTALMGLVYVVLKLVWFFHLQHQPVGDEEDDMEMEEMIVHDSQLLLASPAILERLRL